LIRWRDDKTDVAVAVYICWQFVPAIDKTAVRPVFVQDLGVHSAMVVVLIHLGFDTT
jgi:hypothetical protein